jgi:predicted small metal-binding protein
MKKISVAFDIEFGSTFQEDFFLKILEVMMDTISSHMKRSHKDNKISYEIDTHEGFKIKKRP